MDYNPQIRSPQCPKCQREKEVITHREVAIDRCTNCHELWFDDDEAHQLKAMEGSEVLDSEDPAQGWKYDSAPTSTAPTVAS